MQRPPCICWAALTGKSRARGQLLPGSGAAAVGALF